jgi:hypothetical protein
MPCDGKSSDLTPILFCFFASGVAYIRKNALFLPLVSHFYAICQRATLSYSGREQKERACGGGDGGSA